MPHVMKPLVDFLRNIFKMPMIWWPWMAGLPTDQPVLHLLSPQGGGMGGAGNWAPSRDDHDGPAR